MLRLTMVILLAGTLLLAAGLPALSQEPSLADIARKTKAKKEQSDRKVWTNADFPEPEAPPAPAASPEAEQRSPEQLFAELDGARFELADWKETLELYQRGVEEVRQRLDEADNDYDREAYSRSLDASEDLVIETEQTVEELEARIAELEQLTRNLQRPPPKPPEEEKAEPTPAEQPEGEQPEGELPEAELPPTP